MHLIIDTTKDKSIIALQDASGSFFDMRQELLNMTHSKLLLSKIDVLLRKHSVEKKNIDGIVCVSGPGSYTGSRVGVATTNALAYALQIPAVALNKFEIATGILGEFSGFIVLPSYREHYLVFNTDAKCTEMLSENDLKNCDRDIVLVDEETAQKHDLDFPYTSLDYQSKRYVVKWGDISPNLFKKEGIVPFYFKDPKITQSKKNT